jgi:hypothetical protein
MSYRRGLSSWLVCLLFAASTLPVARADVRVGDVGSGADASRFDPNYPDMKEWAAAGVRGGIPGRAAAKVVRTLKPGDDIQAAIEQAAKAEGGGAVVLSPGVYPVSKRIDLRSNVTLRGESKEAKDKVVLENAMRSKQPGERFFTVYFGDTKKAALEDLTVRHREVARLGQVVYHEKAAGPNNDVNGVADLHVGGVLMERAEDCWIDNVNMLHSGTDPLDAQGSHLTVRDTLIDGAFNKGDTGGPAGSGTVSFSVTRGLMYNTHVRNVRHCVVMRGALAGAECKYNVILDCNFDGDVNFHGNRPDRGHNLVEGVLVRSPLSHGWPAWSYWKREQIGPENLAYRSIGWGGGKTEPFASTDAARVYTFTGIRDPNVLGVVEKPAPRGGTLYAVTGARPTSPEKLGEWPKKPIEAKKMMDARAVPSPTGTSGGTPGAS